MVSRGGRWAARLWFGPPASRGRLRSRAPQASVGRLGDPRDIASMVTMLASPLSGVVNGAEIHVDGGSGV
ncbi:MAG TPA: SDR family oxidoreductase [Caulobacteraceae bacterium]|nr:SDR family oxidoreductase [Caulobacteraceae bacterium]